jgi:hypothetical protein
MATDDQKPDTGTREFSSQAAALAEQLGRIAGTLEGTAEAWLNRASVTDQLTKVRDAATQMLNSLAGGAANGRQAAQTNQAQPPQSAQPPRRSQPAQSSQSAQSSSRGKSGSSAGRSQTAQAAPNRKMRRQAGAASADPAHAPGKQHRKAAPTVRGAKKSESRIPKLRTAAAVRRRRKSYA